MNTSEKSKEMDYCLEKIDNIVNEYVRRFKDDWFECDRKLFIENNLEKSVIIGLRETGCDMLFFGKPEEMGNSVDRVFGNLNNERFLLVSGHCFFMDKDPVQELNFGQAFRLFCNNLSLEYMIQYNYGWKITKKTR